MQDSIIIRWHLLDVAIQTPVHSFIQQTCVKGLDVQIKEVVGLPTAQADGGSTIL